MTGTQKSSITEYRRKGLGYKKISQLTGVSENTIKTYCKRSGLGGVAASALSGGGGNTCKCCGAPIVQISGRKTRKFCNDACRARFWNTHLDVVNRKAYYEYICPACGKPFTAYGNAHRKYCCHECYIDDRFGGGCHE